jgi:hypothetical protein
VDSDVIQPGREVPAGKAAPYRRTFLVAETLIVICGAAGAYQLIDGDHAPPVSDLRPLGLHSWVLPALWLLVTVCVPAAVAAWLAWRRSAVTPDAVVVASATMGLQVLTQIPFVGFNLLQVVFGGVALALAGLASQARGTGWRR